MLELQVPCEFMEAKVGVCLHNPLYSSQESYVTCVYTHVRVVAPSSIPHTFMYMYMCYLYNNNVH